jgi:hypothetical protein
MKFALLVIIGILLFNNNDARQFTAERLYDAADFIDPRTQTEQFLDNIFD